MCIHLVTSTPHASVWGWGGAPVLCQRSAPPSAHCGPIMGPHPAHQAPDVAGRAAGRARGIRQGPVEEADEGAMGPPQYPRHQQRRDQRGTAQGPVREPVKDGGRGGRRHAHDHAVRGTWPPGPWSVLRNMISFFTEFRKALDQCKGHGCALSCPHPPKRLLWACEPAETWGSPCGVLRHAAAPSGGIWRPHLRLIKQRGRLKRSARAVQLFGLLAVVETHTLWYFGHHCCLVVGFDALGIWHF